MAQKIDNLIIESATDSLTYPNGGEVKSQADYRVDVPT
jgi:hypothetical protein